jgi:uncharacterized membrane protein YcaP (DUF421 family)
VPNWLEFAVRTLSAVVYLGLIFLSVLVAFSFGLEFLQLKNRSVRDFINVKDRILLIKDGKVLEDNLKKVRLTNEELIGKLRKIRVFNVSDVEYAIMEPSGNINVLLNWENYH